MRKFAYVLVVLALAAAFIVPAVAEAGKPRIMKGCKACHQAAPDAVRGKLVSHSEGFSTLQVDVGALVWIINYDSNTKMKGVESIAKIPKGKDISVTVKGGDDSPMATRISMKQPYKLPEGQEIKLEELKGMMDSGKPFTLVDARPPKAFFAGHIPDAKLMPYPKFKKMSKDVLPADKDQMVVFYCGGFS